MIQLEVVLVWLGFIDVILLLEIAVTCCLVRLAFHLLKSVGEKGHKYWKQKRHHHRHHDYHIIQLKLCRVTPDKATMQPKMSRKEKIICRSLTSVCFLAILGRWFSQLVVNWFFGFLISPSGRDFCLGVPDANPKKKYPNHQLTINYLIYFACR